MTADQSTYLTVRQFCEKYQWPSQSGLRAIILDAEKNGFAPAINRVNRRVLINQSKFWSIVESKNIAGQNAQ